MRRGPLRGVRVVSLAQNVPGPVALARLVAEGASAVKIEPPAGDPLAGFSRTWYRRLHRGVVVERVDLKMLTGQAVLGRHLEHADLFLTSQRPSALARLGITRTTLRSRWPGVRWLNIVGDTRDPEAPGHDLTYQATVGLIGRDMPRTLVADLLGAQQAVIAGLLLLKNGAPAAAQVGLRDALDPAVMPLRTGLTSSRGILGGALPAYGVYETRRGRVAVAALEPHFRARLYQALGLRDGADLTEVMQTRTARQWERWAALRDLPITRVAV